jgi:hypothetical protein
MANSRTSSLPGLGPLNTLSEVAVSNTSSETTKAQAYWELVTWHIRLVHLAWFQGRWGI